MGRVSSITRLLVPLLVPQFVGFSAIFSPGTGSNSYISSPVTKYSSPSITVPPYSMELYSPKAIPVPIPPHKTPVVKTASKITCILRMNCFLLFVRFPYFCSCTFLCLSFPA